MHVSALLHALVALTPNVADVCDDSDDDLPLPCKWKPPRKRKHHASQAQFDTLEYGKAKEYGMQLYDPRPEELRNTSADRLPQLLADIKGEGLCVSLLLDLSMCVQDCDQSPLSKSELLQKVEALKETLVVTEEDVRAIELSTRAQSQSPKWFEVRRHRLTASNFGRVRQLKSSTPPDNLVLSILGVKKKYGEQLDYGRAMEREAYVQYQQKNGHPDLYATSSGVIVSLTHPFLAASPDANVYDPTSSTPFGFAGYKRNPLYPPSVQ